MADSNFQLKNVNAVVGNLLAAEKRIQKNVQTGMKRAGLFLQRESQKIVPVDQGNLRASAFTRGIGFGTRFTVIVGYTASYAIFVHENPNAAHGKEFNAKHAEAIATKSSGVRNRGENQQFKFLEKPARENAGKILQIVKDAADKKPI